MTPFAAGCAVCGYDLDALRYGFNDWSPVTISERDAEPLGLGMFGVTLTPADLAGQASLQFVRRYQATGWESATRHDVTLGISSPATAGHLPNGVARVLAC